MPYGIRIRRPWWPQGRWQRGTQFRRASTPSGWVYWRNEWPTEASARYRLRALNLLGWRGHVYRIDADGYPWLEVDPDTKLPHPKLARILNEAGRRCGRKLRINEGTRSRARQQALYDAGVKRWGYPAVLKYVAAPGTSNHEDQNGDGWGIAADVVDAIDGENLRPMLARRGLLTWVAAEGAVFPMPHEPWHLELQGVAR